MVAWIAQAFGYEPPQLEVDLQAPAQDSSEAGAPLHMVMASLGAAAPQLVMPEAARQAATDMEALDAVAASFFGEIQDVRNL